MQIVSIGRTSNLVGNVGGYKGWSESSLGKYVMPRRKSFFCFSKYSNSLNPNPMYIYSEKVNFTWYNVINQVI